MYISKFEEFIQYVKRNSDKIRQPFYGFSIEIKVDGVLHTVPSQKCHIQVDGGHRNPYMMIKAFLANHKQVNLDRGNWSCYEARAII